MKIVLFIVALYVLYRLERWQVRDWIKEYLEEIKEKEHDSN